ncbi:hypothetical protein PV325_010945, partial [Microctonus aethiopoides]
YKGWGCSNSTDVYLRSSLILTSLMLIISNIFFLPAIYLATKRKLYAEALVYFATMLFSSFYHACDQNSVNYCIAKYEVLQYSLFLFATVETEANYQYIHSMWHATIALSLIFLLPSASNKVQPDVMINFPSSNSQLLNLNCDSDSPIFAVLDKPEFLMSGSH